jgi:hypothetical protein
MTGAPTVPVMEPASAAPGGIVVHGRWSFDVLEMDGRLLHHTDVENALTSEGANLLTAMLAGDQTRGVTPWLVPLSLSGTAGGIISTSLAEVNPVDRHLTVNVPTTGPDANKLVLTGQFTNNFFDAHVSTFGTTLNTCAGPNCTFKTFTSHTVPAPPDASAIVVGLGQILQVKVVISFAPAT